MQCVQSTELAAAADYVASSKHLLVQCVQSTGLASAVACAASSKQVVQYVQSPGQR